jgi:hypothetical protein
VPTFFNDINSTAIFFSVIVLYAEIHYRLPGIFSRYFKKEPEIIADVPFRIECSQKLPVLILVKDAEKYPIVLDKVVLQIFTSNSKMVELEFFEKTIINSKWWHKVIFADLPKGFENQLRINVQIFYSINNKAKVVNNDNYRQTRGGPFNVFVDRQNLPKTKNWYFGDLHVHTNKTDDQVEFGAPIQATAQMAKCLGLCFFATTDHSYDLDDAEDNYFVNDPDLPKWKKLQDQVKEINLKDPDITIIPGEELSAGNRKNQNVHFLILNNKEFLHGAGDSAENWFRNKPDLSISKAVEQLENNAVAFAAHPEFDLPISQKILLNRGKWLAADYNTKGLTGLQIWNGDKDAAYYKALKKWVQLLLSGRRLYIVAGNDAHGNFGRYRQLQTPFVSMCENDKQLFGKTRTALFINGDVTVEKIISSLKHGKIIVTEGPFANLLMRSENETYGIGDCYSKGQGLLRIECKSSFYFGELFEILLLVGDINSQKETQRYVYSVPLGLYDITIEKKIYDLPTRGYLRLAVQSKKANENFLCLTNPVFINQSKTSESF